MWHFVVILSLFATSFTWASDVIDLSDSDFESRVSASDVMLIEFFAPWCGHCKRLAPEYEKAATMLLQNDPPVPIAKVDCTEAGKESCSKYGVSGYPTLKIFRNGQFSQEYSGPRDANGIVKYMRSQVGPSSKELKTVADFEAFVAKEEVGIIGFLDSDEQLKTAFKAISDKLRETARFAHTSDSAIFKKSGHKDAIVLYRPKQLKNRFEESEVVFSGKADAEEIQKFIDTSFHGLVGHRTTDNTNQFKNPLIIAYYKVDYAKNAKGTNYWRNRVLKVASGFKGKSNFAIANKDEFTHELGEYGVDYVAGDKPVVAARNEKNLKFVMKDEFSIESFEKFVNQFIAGELEPFLKSEPVPEDNDGPVKVAVAKNFDELVMGDDKDVLIEFYAPWCGHCKKLTPVYEELGKELEGEDSVVIVKMDATANDVPAPFEVSGFPTLFWAPKKNKSSPQRYDGGREVADFIKYIAKHSTEDLKGYDRNGNKKKSEL